MRSDAARQERGTNLESHLNQRLPCGAAFTQQLTIRKHDCAIAAYTRIGKVKVIDLAASFAVLRFGSG
jgi:hypothetical protein